jgi:flagellin
VTGSALTASVTVAADDIIVNGTSVVADPDYTLAELADAINTAAGADVASVVTDADGDHIQITSTEELTLTGNNLAIAGLNEVGNVTTTIDNVSVATREDSMIAIQSVDAALMQIDSIRGGLGAVQNRFESTIANLNNVAENLSAARSRILDADIAMETSAMTKQNILQQAGVAILAQANQTPQLALSLLQG